MVSPWITVDKQGKILVNGPNYEHYMDMIQMLAVQLDDLPGGNPTDGKCVARVGPFQPKGAKVLKKKKKIQGTWKSSRMIPGCSLMLPDTFHDPQLPL
jgi:hypothetical protein